MGALTQLLIFGVPTLLALVAYLLPGARVLRSIAGALCILAAGFLTFLMLSADSDEVLRILGMVVVLSGLIIAIRPERKPAPAAGPPGRPAPVPPPYGQQGYSPQPYQAQQSPTPQPPQQNIPTPPSLQQPQQPHPQQLQQNIPTPPSLQQQPPTQPSPQQQSSAHPSAG